MVGTLGLQVVRRNTDGAVVAGEGVLVSLLPLLVHRLSRIHVPRALELAFVLGMALQFVSESLKLFEVFTYWDKIVHPFLIADTAMIATWLMLGFKDTFQRMIPDRLVALFAMLFGMCLGTAWEFVEFTADWFGNAGLQKSNADTMTDIYANDIGAVIATLIGMWIYARVLSNQQRRELGQIAGWLGGGLAGFLDRRGRLVGVALGLATAGLIGAAVWMDRDTPALADGLAPGQSLAWTFTGGPLSDVQPLSGDWVPDAPGICRENLDDPKPGSEKVGLIQLAPGTAYAQDNQGVTIQAHYLEERPPNGQGTQMDAGIAFGIRDANDYYVLEESALHDVLRLDRYVHGKRREIRDKLVRTHGNEWHTLQLTIRGTEVAAGMDDQEIYRVTGLVDTTGGVGIWARTSAATCFSEVRISLESVG